MTNTREIPERKRIVATENDPFRGHELARIAEGLPGDEPTNARNPDDYPLFVAVGANDLEAHLVTTPAA